jgi:hypothetical protein
MRLSTYQYVSALGFAKGCREVFRPLKGLTGAMLNTVSWKGHGIRCGCPVKSEVYLLDISALAGLGAERESRGACQKSRCEETRVLHHGL